MSADVTLTADPGLVAYVCLLVMMFASAVIIMVYGKDDDL